MRRSRARLYRAAAVESLEVRRLLAVPIVVVIARGVSSFWTSFSSKSLFSDI